MAVKLSYTYTGTGAGAAIDINSSHNVSWGVKSNTGDAVFTIQYFIGDPTDGGWYDSGLAPIVEGRIYTTAGGADKMRINISSMGTAASVDLDITAGNY
jgi:hypothetical protein